jgi:hypothetical protein
LSGAADSGKALPMDEERRPMTREERLAARLRENLRRRKAQARSRAAAGGTDRPPGTHDSAGIDDDKP